MVHRISAHYLPLTAYSLLRTPSRNHLLHTTSQADFAGDLHLVVADVSAEQPSASFAPRALLAARASPQKAKMMPKLSYHYCCCYLYYLLPTASPLTTHYRRRRRVRSGLLRVPQRG